MTQAITVTIAPEPRRVRILAQTPQHRVLQAILSPISTRQGRALPLLLEALSACQPDALSVVLCADESGTGLLSETFGVLADAGTSRWSLGLAVVAGRRRCGADWRHAFDDLGQLQSGGQS